MTSIRTYTIIFVALMVASTVQAIFEFSGYLHEAYGISLVIILVISTIKALFVAGWYMHALEEPRAISYVALAGLLGVIALTAGATYSTI